MAYRPDDVQACSDIACLEMPVRRDKKENKTEDREYWIGRIGRIIVDNRDEFSRRHGEEGRSRWEWREEGG